MGKPAVRNMIGGFIILVTMVLPLSAYADETEPQGTTEVTVQAVEQPRFDVAIGDLDQTGVPVPAWAAMAITTGICSLAGYVKHR